MMQDTFLSLFQQFMADLLLKIPLYFELSSPHDHVIASWIHCLETAYGNLLKEETFLRGIAHQIEQYATL